MQMIDLRILRPKTVETVYSVFTNNLENNNLINKIKIVNKASLLS